MWKLHLLAAVFAVSLLEIGCSPAVFRFDQHHLDENQSVKQSYQESLKGKKKAEASQCGYQGCDLGKPGYLNVHLVPHTHDDVGWLKTVDQYYYGSKSNIQNAGVQYILDTVITNLLADPARRFIYVEIAFFYRWWNEQNEDRRNDVRMLVNEGRLEFILGGWCMNDEAATHYNAIIDQHTLGFKFLKEEFGECATPRIGWQIDPFGHSREQASLFAQFGFDGLFFGRLDYQDKDKRLQDHTMESMWMGSQNLELETTKLIYGGDSSVRGDGGGRGCEVRADATYSIPEHKACKNCWHSKGDQAALFTGVNFNGYGPPGGFCFQCGDTPVMDDARLEDYNVPDRVKDFVKAAKDQERNYTTNHIMMTMGSDFQYENAHMNFKNLDKLIKYVNELEGEKSKINVIYSTPGCYLYALNQANQTYTQKTDDFFPYASRAFTFWTGYFTSRPALKGYVRKCNNFLQTCKQIDALAMLDAEFDTKPRLDRFKQAMGVAQHHDAVSGTEKQAVAYDYALRLARGETECQTVVNLGLAKYIANGAMNDSPIQSFCSLNVSRCDVSETNKAFTVLVYNPVARPVDAWVRIPVRGSAYTVKDGTLAPVLSQTVPLSDATKNIPAHNGSTAVNEIVFKVASVPGLGFSTYFVEEANEEEETVESASNEEAGIVSIENEHLTLNFDIQTNMLATVENKKASLTANVAQSMKWYKSFKGNNSKDIFQASGAYVFRPDGNTPNELPARIVKVTKGTEVQEVEQTFGDFASQVVRLYKGANYAEIEWTVGPIPYKDGIGKEVISRFDSNLATHGSFFTDANGREVLLRKRDYRSTWTLNQTEKVAGNYYPVNSRIYIRDLAKNMQLTVLNDRSQGGASIKDGSMELMVHRRVFVDDSFGVGEPLNETGLTDEGLVVRGKHYLLLDSIKDSGREHRDLGEKIFMAPEVMLAPLNMPAQDYVNKYNVEMSGLTRSLPDNVHLLTLEQWGADTLLLRLEHFYEKGEDAVLSQPATVSLQGLFAPFDIVSAKELTLGGNRDLDNASRLQWNVQNFGTTKADMSSYVTKLDAELTVKLNPMQIRTFEIRVQAQ